MNAISSSFFMFFDALRLLLITKSWLFAAKVYIIFGKHIHSCSFLELQVYESAKNFNFRIHFLKKTTNRSNRDNKKGLSKIVWGLNILGALFRGLK